MDTYAKKLEEAIDKRPDLAPTISGHKSSGILTRADEMKGLKREVVVTLSIPKGYQAEYLKAIQKALPEFKVEKLAKCGYRWRPLSTNSRDRVVG